MNVMLDPNVLLDYLQKRVPYYHYSSLVVKEVLQHTICGFVPAHSLTTVFYILAKQSGRQKANEEIDWLLTRFEVAPTDKAVFLQARKLGIDDFEDAVVASLAESSGCNYIITRNVPDFKNSSIQAITPEDFVKHYVFKTDQTGGQQAQPTADTRE